MKNLADLKRNVANFSWSLLENSWHEDIPDFMSEARKVATVQASRFSLWTNKEGKLSESWIDFPKAKELKIDREEEGYKITITRDCGDLEPHTMIYFLRGV